MSGAGAVIGASDHYGRAELVTLAVEDGAAVFLDRRRVALIDKGLPIAPYHHEAPALDIGPATALVNQVRRSVAQHARSAISTVLDTCAARVLILPSSPYQGLPDSLEEVLNSRPLTLAADGMLYRESLGRRCRRARPGGSKILSQDRPEDTRCQGNGGRSSPGLLAPRSVRSCRGTAVAQGPQDGRRRGPQRPRAANPVPDSTAPRRSTRLRKHRRESSSAGPRVAVRSRCGPSEGSRGASETGHRKRKPALRPPNRGRPLVHSPRNSLDFGILTVGADGCRRPWFRMPTLR